MGEKCWFEMSWLVLKSDTGMQVHLPFYHIEMVAAPLAYNMESLGIKPLYYRDKNLRTVIVFIGRERFGNPCERAI